MSSASIATKPAKPPKPKRPHLPFVPTDEQRGMVKILVATKVQVPIIAALIINPDTKKGISKNTLKRKFKEELINGKALVGAYVTSKLFKLIEKEHFGAIRLYLEAQEGWRTTNRPEGEFDPEDAMPQLPALPGGTVIDVTPELIPDDPALASQIYQRMVNG